MKSQPSTLVQSLKVYFREDFIDELNSWKSLIRYYAVLWASALLVLTGLYFYIEPFPYTPAILFKDATGASFSTRSTNYEKYFAENDLNLLSKDVAGLREAIAKVSAPDSKQAAAFSFAGALPEQRADQLYSLGAVDLVPIWLFYRGDLTFTKDLVSSLGGKTVNIGTENSTAQIVYRELFKQTIVDQTLTLANEEAYQKLMAGEIDAVFLVGPLASPAVQKLLNTKNIKLYNFELADAYIKIFPVLEKVVIPQGALNIEQMKPDHDITLLAATLELVVDKTLHPAYQWAFLLATQQFHSKTEGFFTPPKYFPRETKGNVALSPIAIDYFNHGTPHLFSYFPIWIAASINQFWVYIVAAILVGYPILSRIGDIRESHTKWVLLVLFMKLRRLEEKMVKAQTLSQLEEYKAILDRLESDIVYRWIDSSIVIDYFQLRGSFAPVHDTYERMHTRLSNAAPVSSIPG